MTPRTEPLPVLSIESRRLRRPTLVEAVAALAVSAWVTLDLVIVLHLNP